MKKEIISIDEPSVCGIIAFNYDSKKEALKDIRKTTGESITREEQKEIKKAKIMKFKRDGEDYYYWGDICECCGTKNNGYNSYIWLG